MQETWKDIKDFEGLYQISDHGKFRRHPLKQGKTKNPKPFERAISINKDGYQYIDLCCKGIKSKKTVHQAVAAAFISGFEYGTQVNHKNGNKCDNHISNLESSNYSHNNAHAHATGLTPKPGKSQYFNVSIRLDKRDKNPVPKYVASVKIQGKRNYIGSYSDEIEAAKAVDTFLDSIGDKTRQRNFP